MLFVALLSDFIYSLNYMGKFGSYLIEKKFMSIIKSSLLMLYVQIIWYWYWYIC